MKNYIKRIIKVCVAILVFHIFTPMTLMAAEESNVVNNYKYEILNKSSIVGQNKEDDFAVYFDDERVVFNYEFEDDSFKLTIKTDTETHSITYNTNDNFMVMNGEIIPVEKNEIVIEDLSDNFSSNKVTPLYSWSPVFYTSGSVAVGRTVSTIGALATLIGGVIGVGILINLNITQSEIANKIGAWASAVSLGALVGGYYFDGAVTYSQYRTQTPVPDGGPSGMRQYAYRFQNVRAIGAIKGKTMNIELLNIGSWFFTQRPY